MKNARDITNNNKEKICDLVLFNLIIYPLIKNRSKIEIISPKMNNINNIFPNIENGFPFNVAEMAGY